MSTEEGMPAESAELVQERKRLNKAVRAMKITMIGVGVIVLAMLAAAYFGGPEKLTPSVLILPIAFIVFSQVAMATLSGKINDLNIRAESERAQEETAA